MEYSAPAPWSSAPRVGVGINSFRVSSAVALDCPWLSGFPDLEKCSLDAELVHPVEKASNIASRKDYIQALYIERHA